MEVQSLPALEVTAVTGVLETEEIGAPGMEHKAGTVLTLEEGVMPAKVPLHDILLVVTLVKVEEKATVREAITVAAIPQGA